jgi:SAM-dependent methyltransferase
MTDKPFADSAARNAPPILEVLEKELRGCRDVLEIGSGTGQHAVAFAEAMPHLVWQTSELAEHHAGINAWVAHAALDNVLPPIELDVRQANLAPASFDAVYSANTAHIMSIAAVQCMFSLVGDVLRADGVFCLYGPFRIGGRFNTASNEAFDRSLRERAAEMGIRDIETLDEFGFAGGLHRRALYALPANNYAAVWTRRVQA